MLKYSLQKVIDLFELFEGFRTSAIEFNNIKPIN